MLNLKPKQISPMQRELSLQARREPRYKLADLMAEMPAGKLPMVVGWDTLNQSAMNPRNGG